MSNVWFTSDLHLFHRAMAWQRKYGRWPLPEDKQTAEYANPEALTAEHNERLALEWDRTVKPGDAVWVLGDLTMGENSLDRALVWVNERPGKKHLIFGNHDPAHPMHSDSWKWQERYWQAFDSMQMAESRKIALPDGSRVRAILSHFPYTGDGELKEDRDLQWRMRDMGQPIIHGHVHSTERLTIAATGYASAQIHVGVDAWNYRPVHLNQVAELIAKRGGHT